jgi:hypothetical protein
VTTRGGVLAALLAALGRPSWWILGLAGFLVRGGIVVFIVAIITLPSPLALSNVLEPYIEPIYLGRLDPATIALAATAVAAALAWLLAGSWFAAATEVVLIRDAHQAAADEGLPVGSRPPAGRMLVARAMAAHLAALVPLAVALGIGSVQILAVIYIELTNPGDASPIALRVIGGAVGPLAAIAIAWILGEIVGGGAARRVVVSGESVAGAVVRSAVDLVRRPGGSLVAPLAISVVLLADLAAVLVVVAITWTQVRVRLVGALDQPLALVLALVTFSAAWSLALLVTGLIAAWRSVAMTFQAERIAASSEVRAAIGTGGESHPGSSGNGTIGASAHRRPGDWSADDRGGSL